MADSLKSIVGGDSGIFGGEYHTVTFTSNTTWYPPNKLVWVYVSGCGGGGQGGGGTGSAGGGGGGGGGYGYRIPVLVSRALNPSGISITIGAGGSANTDDGENGGDTSFGSYVTFGGGVGGGDSGTGDSAGGAGGVVTIGTGRCPIDDANFPAGGAGGAATDPPSDGSAASTYAIAPTTDYLDPMPFPMEATWTPPTTDTHWGKGILFKARVSGGAGGGAGSDGFAEPGADGGSSTALTDGGFLVSGSYGGATGGAGGSYNFGGDGGGGGGASAGIGGAGMDGYYDTVAYGPGAGGGGGGESEDNTSGGEAGGAGEIVLEWFS